MARLKVIASPTGALQYINDEGLIVFKESVANEAALPPSSNSVNDARITSDDGHLWIWNGSEWIDQGDVIDIDWSVITNKPSSSVANIDDAVSKRHVQGTDQTLDDGGLNEVSAEELRTFLDNFTALTADDIETNETGVTVQEKLDELDSGKADTVHTHVQTSITNLVPDLARITMNILLLAFRLSVANSLTVFNMIDGMSDEFESEDGVDLDESLNETYNAGGDYYQPSGEDGTIKLFTLFDGEDGATFAQDESEGGHTLVFNGDAQLDTAEKKFGTASLVLGGTDSVTIADSSDWDVVADNTADWVIDFQVKYGITPSGTQCFISHGTGTPETNYSICHNSTNGLTFEVVVAGVTAFTFNSSGETKIEDTNWHHIAFIKKGQDYGLYLDGVQTGYGTSATEWDFTGLFIIGERLQGDLGLTGWIDELHVINSDYYNTTPTVGVDDTFTAPASQQHREVDDMTLISKAFTAESAPDNARIVIFQEDISFGIVLNTDVKAYVSRDNGTTYSQVTLVDEGDYDTTKRILSGAVSLTGQPSGTSIRYKIETINFANVKEHGVGLAWDD